VQQRDAMRDTVGAMTERLLVDAGIGAGMRVLDVGCGRGDVAFLAARLVGEQGRVVGVDREPSALAVARDRARELGLAHVSFIEADFGALSPELGLFDAAIGRRVLMYQSDPVGAVRSLVRVLRAGGRVVFQEHDATIGPASLGALPLHEQVHGWIWQTVEREGADVHMGFHLASVLERAGLRVAQVRAEAIVQTPTTRYPVGPILRAMLERIEQQGIARRGEIDADTIDQRLADERQRANATYVGELVFGGWALVPASGTP
jgi:ubiquinone/menaquinone biosynthesis C-methylase UbiE